MTGCFDADALERIVPAAVSSLAVFQTYDADGRPFDDDVVEYVTQLAQQFDKVVVVSNARFGETGNGLPDGTTVCVVPNGGLDFGMWVRVLKNLDRPGLRCLGLFNDSTTIVGALAPCFSAARARAWDFWGMVLSDELCRHVQSWFLVADSEPCVRRVLDFFRSLDVEWLMGASKHHAVWGCELGLSRHMSEVTTLHGLYSMADVLEAVPPRQTDPNPSFYYWDALRYLGCPLLKKSRADVPGGGGLGDGAGDVPGGGGGLGARGLSSRTMKSMKLVVYVLCYDDTSEAAAKDEFEKHEWARVVRLPDDRRTGKYMEGAAFLGTLQSRKAEWHDADLVGTMSWKASLKIDVNAVADACRRCAGADVVTFLPSTDMLLRSVLHHPRFLEVWVPLLSHLGYSAPDIVHSDMPAFYCNYWMATPAWMDRFMAFYARVHRALEDLPCIQDALWSHAGYPTHLTRERCIQVYGRPYIPYHPFVCERVPCFFFWKEGASIAPAPLGKAEFLRACHDAEVAKVCGQ